MTPSLEDRLAWMAAIILAAIILTLPFILWATTHN